MLARHARRDVASTTARVAQMWHLACLIIIIACMPGARATLLAGDRAALVDFYNAAGGAVPSPGGWLHFRWDLNADVCTAWTGVTCSAMEAV